MNRWQVSCLAATMRLLFVLSPQEDSFCRCRADPVWSCHVQFCRWALTSMRLDRNDLTSPITADTEKALSSLCAAEEVYFGQSASWCQRRHTLRGVNRKQREVLTVRTSTHPHWGTHMLRPKLLTYTAMKKGMNLQHQTVQTNLYLQLSTFSTSFCQSII